MVPHSNANSASTPRRQSLDQYIKNFKKLETEKQTNLFTQEANLQPSRTSTTDHFPANSQRLKVVNCFCKKAPSEIFVWALNMIPYLSITCVSTRKMLAKLPHKKCLKKATNSLKKTFYQQKTTNILTQYGLPIKSDLIFRGKQCRSNNKKIDSPQNHVL